MSIAFVSVTTAEQVTELCARAREIWEEHFTPIIGESQVEYMLLKFQSVPAVTAQLERGYRYFLFKEEGETVGYTGIEGQEGKLFLSKLYIRRESRGKKYASRAVQFLCGLCREEGLSSIWLTVNRHNDRTIAIYKKLGFAVTREQVTDIGNGFVMDDYIMEKPVEAEPE